MDISFVEATGCEREHRYNIAKIYPWLEATYASLRLVEIECILPVRE